MSGTVISGWTLGNEDPVIEIKETTKTLLHVNSGVQDVMYLGAGLATRQTGTSEPLVWLRVA